MEKKSEKKDPTWTPPTPMKCESKSSMPHKENENSRKRKRMIRHRPKVFDKRKPLKPTPKPKGPGPATPKPKTPKAPRKPKTPGPATPKPKTPRPSRCVKSEVDSEDKEECSGKISCVKMLDFGKKRADERCNVLQVYRRRSKVFKRKRTRRERMSLETLIRLIRMVRQKTCFGTITWNKRRRTRLSVRRKDFSLLVPVLQVENGDSFVVKRCKHDKNDEHVVAVDGECGTNVCAAEPVESTVEIQDEVCQVDDELVNQCRFRQDNVDCKNKIVGSCAECGDCICADDGSVGSIQERKNVTSIQDGAFEKALVDFATKRMNSLNIVDESNQLVMLDTKENHMHQLMVLYKKNNKQMVPKVDLDEKTIRVWRTLMEDEEEIDDNMDDNMEDEQEIFRARVDSFIRLMYHLSGDRRFSRWKGSVVDSVVGVILTQNVSDSLSSNAFMTIAARYPAKSKNDQNNCTDLITQLEKEESPSSNDEESNSKNQVDVENDNKTSSINHEHEASTGRKKGNTKNKKENLINWDELRRKYSNVSRKRGQREADIVDWEAVRRASVSELAKLIEERGQSNQLTPRIKDFLDRLVKDHGSIDLEWLRDVPPDKAKDYLMSINGIGLKSTECVRLLSLYQPAFPIDVNAGRVLVRLGWVPLQPLPDDVPLHLLNDYPALSDVQKYIWPRICDCDALTLYELHCYLNIFSKAFCTKTRPNCNACPMRAECKHYASKLASSRPQLEGYKMASETPVLTNTVSSEPIVEFPPSPEPEPANTCCGSPPIVEFPASSELEPDEPLGGDIEDLTYEPLGDIEDFTYESHCSTITLGLKENSPSYVEYDEALSKAVVALTPRIAPIPMPKVEYVDRLRTVHNVHELPDSHPLLAGFPKREPEDPCPYLLATWTTSERTDTYQKLKAPGNSQEPGSMNSCQEFEELCSSRESVTDATNTCNLREIVQYRNGQRVRGTILIPCRTANQGAFPLNGTYFQINEVFADHESSVRPIEVPIEWIQNLRNRTLYCGKNVTSICRGMYIGETAYFFRLGYMCIRGFEVKTGRPRMLSSIFRDNKSGQSGKK